MGWYGDDVHLFYSRISEVENLLDNLTVDDIDPNIKPPDSILKTSDLIQSIKYAIINIQCPHCSSSLCVAAYRTLFIKELRKWYTEHVKPVEVYGKNLNGLTQPDDTCSPRFHRANKPVDLTFQPRSPMNVASRASEMPEGETVYGYGPISRWDAAGGKQKYLCSKCSTTDHSYPGGGRGSDNLNHPRWDEKCNGCGKPNIFHRTHFRKRRQLALKGLQLLSD